MNQLARSFDANADYSGANKSKQKIYWVLIVAAGLLLAVRGGSLLDSLRSSTDERQAESNAIFERHNAESDKTLSEESYAMTHTAHATADQAADHDVTTPAAAPTESKSSQVTQSDTPKVDAPEHPSHHDTQAASDDSASELATHETQASPAPEPSNTAAEANAAPATDVVTRASQDTPVDQATTRDETRETNSPESWTPVAAHESTSLVADTHQAVDSSVPPAIDESSPTDAPADHTAQETVADAARPNEATTAGAAEINIAPPSDATLREATEVVAEVAGENNVTESLVAEKAENTPAETAQTADPQAETTAESNPNTEAVADEAEILTAIGQLLAEAQAATAAEASVETPAEPTSEPAETNENPTDNVADNATDTTTSTETKAATSRATTFAAAEPAASPTEPAVNESTATHAASTAADTATDGSITSAELPAKQTADQTAEQVTEEVAIEPATEKPTAESLATTASTHDDTPNVEASATSDASPQEDETSTAANQSTEIAHESPVVSADVVAETSSSHAEPSTAESVSTESTDDGSTTVSPPADLPPAPAAVEKGNTTDELVLVNPPDALGTVRYLINGYEYAMPPGHSQHLPGDRTWRVNYHRGGDFGNVDVELHRGVYEFRVGKSGWDLSAE